MLPTLQEVAQYGFKGCCTAPPRAVLLTAHGVLLTLTPTDRAQPTLSFKCESCETLVAGGPEFFPLGYMSGIKLGLVWQ